MYLHLSILILNRRTFTFGFLQNTCLSFWTQTLALLHLTNENKLLICCPLLADFVLGVNLWTREQILDRIASILKRLHNVPKTDNLPRSLLTDSAVFDSSVSSYFTPPVSSKNMLTSHFRKLHKYFD